MLDRPPPPPRPSPAVFVFVLGDPSFDEARARLLALRVEVARSVGAHAVVLDFSDVRFLSAAGIAQLADIAEAAEPSCRLIAAALSPETLALAHASCLQDAVPLYASVSAALTGLAR